MSRRLVNSTSMGKGKWEIGMPTMGFEVGGIGEGKEEGRLR